jgi:Flp pilus assembly protein TadB
MKSDQEFLAGVWNHIANLETDEREKAAAHRRNRALQIRRVAELGVALLVFALVAVLLLLGGHAWMDARFALAGLLLAGGYVAESRATAPTAHHERKGLQK